MENEEARILEKLTRIIENKLEHPEFFPGGVPVKVAAAVYGKGPYFVQEGLRAGWLPIGHCSRGNKKDNFYISPLKLWEDTGFIYKGQSVEEVEALRKEMKNKCTN